MQPYQVPCQAKAELLLLEWMGCIALCLHSCLQFITHSTGKEPLAFPAGMSCFLKALWPVNDYTGLKYCIFIKDFSRDALLILKPHFCMDSSFLTVTILASGVCE